VNGTQSILRKHLLPMFGRKRLDQIDDEDIQGSRASCAIGA
jgi:hypothetical protein